LSFEDENEETIHEEAELIKREQEEALEEAEEIERPVEEEEEVGEYHPIRVELVAVLLDAIDILEKLAKGEIDVTKARAEYAQKVELASRQLVEEVKPPKRASTTTKKKRSKKKTSSSTSTKRRRKKSSSSS